MGDLSIKVLPGTPADSPVPNGESVAYLKDKSHVSLSDADVDDPKGALIVRNPLTSSSPAENVDLCESGLFTPKESTLEAEPSGRHTPWRRKRKRSQLIDLNDPIEALDSGFNVRDEWKKRALGAGGEQTDYSDPKTADPAAEEARTFREHVSSVLININDNYCCGDDA